MITETKTALVDAAILSANVEKASTAAWGMEIPVTDIEHTAETIMLTASGMGEISGNDKDVGAFHFLADKLKESAESFGSYRGTILDAMRACTREPESVVDNAAFLSREWRDLFDRLHEGETFPNVALEGPDGDRLEALEEAIHKAPIRSAHDALAKLRLWLVFRGGQSEPGTPCKTVAELETEALEHGRSFDDADCYVADVFAWLHAICEGQPEEGGAS